MNFLDSSSVYSYKLQFGTNKNWTIQKYSTGLSFDLTYGSYARKYNLFLNGYGNVGINSVGSSRTLDIKGDTRWDDPNDSNNNDIVLDWSDYGRAVLWPTRPYQLNLGSSYNRINRLYCDKVYYTTSLIKSSDKRMKEDIVTISDVMPKLNKIHSYNYRFKASVFANAPETVKQRNSQTKEYGFLAQEIKEVFPSLVHTVDSGMLAVDYVGMIPILLEAIKEQNTQISQLQEQSVPNALLLQRIQKLEKELEEKDNKTQTLKTYSETENSIIEEETTQKLKLFANQPNPFSEQTTIKMMVPESVSDATVRIYNLSGQQILAIEVTERGNASVVVEGNELKPGMYLYSLIADNTVVDTFTMIVTE